MENKYLKKLDASKQKMLEALALQFARLVYNQGFDLLDLVATDDTWRRYGEWDRYADSFDEFIYEYVPRDFRDYIRDEYDSLLVYDGRKHDKNIMNLVSPMPEQSFEEYLSKYPPCEYVYPAFVTYPQKIIIEWKNYIIDAAFNDEASKKQISDYYLTEDGNIQEELDTFVNYIKSVSEDENFYLNNYYTLKKLLSKNIFINLPRIQSISDMLDASIDLEKDIIELLESDEILFLLYATILMKNGKNKAFCIASINRIFNSNIEIKKYSVEDIKKLVEDNMEEESRSYSENVNVFKKCIKAFGSGLSINDFVSVVGFEKTYSTVRYSDWDRRRMPAYFCFSVFGYDMNYQDENGDTYFMYLMKNKYDIQNIIDRFEFDLYTTNNDGLNTLEVAYKYVTWSWDIKQLEEIYGVKENANNKLKKYLKCVKENAQNL